MCLQEESVVHFFSRCSRSSTFRPSIAEANCFPDEHDFHFSSGPLLHLVREGSVSSPNRGIFLAYFLLLDQHTYTPASQQTLIRSRRQALAPFHNKYPLLSVSKHLFFISKHLLFIRKHLLFISKHLSRFVTSFPNALVIPQSLQHPDLYPAIQQKFPGVMGRAL